MPLVGSQVIKIECLWETSALFIFVFKSVFMSMLLIKILLLYPEVFPTVKFKLLGIMDSNSFLLCVVYSAIILKIQIQLYPLGHSKHYLTHPLIRIHYLYTVYKSIG